MPDVLPGVSPVGQGDWVRINLYSYPGWGKTSLIATGAEAGLRTLIIRSSMDLIPTRALRSGCENVVADTWEKMLEIQDFFRMADHGYDWVWWDNISVAEDVLLDDIWAGTVAVKPARAYKLDGQGKIVGPNLDPSSGLDKGEYGRNMERIQQWVRHMVGCNSFHFGITAHPHEGRHPTNDEGGTLLRPYVQGKNMTEKITGWMNMVGFLEVMEGNDQKWRRLHVAENSRFYAKDQYDSMPKGYMDNPTIPRIMEGIEKARGRPLGKGGTQAVQPSVRGAARGRGTVTPIRGRGRGARA